MNTRGRTVRLATRGSDLAVRQAATVRDALADRRYDVELVEVETTGDTVRDELIHELGTTGAFVRSLDEKVLAGDVDAAVHSMKDVPTEGREDLVVAGVPQRGPPGDVLVTPEGQSLEDLPENPTIGTASLRRQAQLHTERDDCTVHPVRGNVDTRVEKLLAPGLQRAFAARVEAAQDAEVEHRVDDYEAADAGRPDGPAGRDGQRTDDGAPGFASARSSRLGDDGEEKDGSAGVDEDATDDSDGDGGGDDDQFDESFDDWFDGLAEIERCALEREVDVELDALVLAEAGLERIGLAHHVGTRPLPTTSFVPAPGQGALAVTARNEPFARELKDVLDHPPTRVATTVERTVLATLGGGCVAPLGVHAVLQGDVVRTQVRVLSRDGSETVAATRELPVGSHVRAAESFAEDLADRGAADLVAAAVADADAGGRGSRDDADESGGADT